MGPFQIAKRLTEEKVEKPSYYQASRGRGNYKTMCDFEMPYNWTGGSVVRILERPEYMGDTVNFRSHKESYKDKKQTRNDSSSILVFRDTHEAVIDRRTWYMVQELRKTVRRYDTDGTNSMLTGKLYCADCGGKMHYRRSTTRAGRDWRGIPNGEVQRTSAGFNCGTYNSARKQNRKACCSHSIKEDTVKQLILETIQYALKSVRMDEVAFIKSMRSASEVRDRGEVKRLKSELAKKEKRFADLDLLIKKVYEDNAMGRLPMKTKNHNIRFNTEKEDECRAWEFLHSPQVRQMFKSQNKFVIEAVNDYFDRCVAVVNDPYLETREKEDAFAERIVEAVEKKVMSNLPALFGMYMAQIQPFPLSVPMGAYQAAQGIVYGQTSANGTNKGNAVMSKEVLPTASNLADTETVQSGEAVTEPPDNDLIDFDAF